MSIFDAVNEKKLFRGRREPEAVPEKRASKNRPITIIVLILVIVAFLWFLAQPKTAPELPSNELLLESQSEPESKPSPPPLRAMTQPEVNTLVQLQQAKFEPLKKLDLAALETVKTTLQEQITALLDNAKEKKKADDDVRIAIAANPKLPVDYLERLSFTEARIGVAKNPATPLEILARLSLDFDKDVRVAVANNPNTPPEVFPSLAMDEDTDILLALASNPNLPEQLLDHFIQEGGVGFFSDCDFKELLFSHNKLVLNRLEENKDHSLFCVRTGVASNPNATPELLSQFAKDEDWLVRAAVAKNLNASSELLLQLSKDESWFVRVAVAENHTTSPELLSQLVKDESSFVRDAVAKNPNTPTETLTYLVNNEEDGWLPTPRDLAFSNPNISRELLEEYVPVDDLNISPNLAENTGLPESILSQLFSLNNRAINEIIARNPATPITLLEQMEQDDSMFFNLRDDVASNPNYPVESLISLLDKSAEQSAGVKGLLNEMSSFNGVSPEFIDKWKDDEVTVKEHQQLERYIFMVFWDNFFHPNTLDELYRQALTSLQSELENNRKAAFAEIVGDLTNKSVVKMKLVFDQKQLQQDFETALPAFSEQIQLSENLSGLVNEKPESASHLTLQVLLKGLITDVIKETAIPVLKDVALKMTAKRGASKLVSSIPGLKVDPRKKLLRVTLSLAIGVLGSAYDLYAQQGLDENLTAELVQLKNNLITVSDENLQKAVESYHLKMNGAFNDTLTKNVSVKR